MMMMNYLTARHDMCGDTLQAHSLNLSPYPLAALAAALAALFNF
jgi:hypothetical protein